MGESTLVRSFKRESWYLSY